MYELAYEQLERWRNWRIFSEDDIARMLEVELASDLVKNMIDGLSGKSQKTLDDLHRRYDDGLPRSRVVAKRFRYVLDQIDELFGDQLRDTVFRSEVYFFSLFTFLYEQM